MVKLKALGRHALPFARYWCRPLEQPWRSGLRTDLVLLVISCTLIGGWVSECFFAWFLISVIGYTRWTLRQYRAGRGRDDEPPGGDRYEVHDRHDTFRRSPWQ